MLMKSIEILMKSIEMCMKSLKIYFIFKSNDV